MNIFDDSYSLAKQALEESDAPDNVDILADAETLADAITKVVMEFMANRDYRLID